MNPTGPEIIGTILKHDAKITSYKIALLRAINDVALAYPDVQPGVQPGERPVAIPLRFLAEFWIAYYWPFVDSRAPIPQGQNARRSQGTANDMAFRPALTQLRQQWESFIGEASQPADGFFLINEMRVPRRRAGYPGPFRDAYQQAVKVIARTLLMPIQHAGPGHWTVFDRPDKYKNLSGVMALPGTQSEDVCLICDAVLWQSFRDLSLWIEALAIHEWCLFSERAQANAPGPIGRGQVYELLTARPDNRRPLTWERNQIDLLVMEGTTFVCPWTQKAIGPHRPYDIDHLIPISIYPVNELWNLVPSDPYFNSHVKSNRLPSPERLSLATPLLARAYVNYQVSTALKIALTDDVAVRFALVPTRGPDFAEALAQAVADLIGLVRDARNLRQF